MSVSCVASCVAGAESLPIFQDQVVGRNTSYVFGRGIGVWPSKLHPVHKDDESVTEIVPRIRLDALIDDLPLDRIDLLTMDIDGLEMEPLFEPRGDQLAKVITVEFHDD